MDKLQFLERNFVSVEATIRAFDVKAQIVLASLALSYEPVSLTIRQLDSSPTMNLRLGLVFCFFCISALMFLRVLAPYADRRRLGADAGVRLFFLRTPEAMDAVQYLRDLDSADLLAAYSAEVIALHRIRATKDRRFRQALGVLFAYFVVVLLYGVAIIAKIL